MKFLRLHHIWPALMLVLLAFSCKKKEEVLHVQGSILAGERDPGLYYREFPGEGIGSSQVGGLTTTSIAMEEGTLGNVLYFALQSESDLSLDYWNQGISCNGNSPKVEILVQSLLDTTFHCQIAGAGVDTLFIFSGFPGSICNGDLIDTLVSEIKVPKQVEEGEQIGPNSGIWLEGPAFIAHYFQERAENGNTNGDYLITTRQYQFWDDASPHYVGFRVVEGGAARYGYVSLRVFGFSAIELFSVCVEK